jgi:hypothetical protein
MATRTTKPRKRAVQRDDRPPVNQAAIDLLRAWREASEEEAQEQQETFEALKKGIDEERARLGMRLLFS